MQDQWKMMNHVMMAEAILNKYNSSYFQIFLEMEQLSKMKNKLTPKALLFDMDGVLVDSFESWWKSLNKALEEEKQKTIKRETFIKEYWGDTLQQNLKKLGIKKDNNQFCNSFYQHYINEVNLFDETKKTLESLHRYQKAIITNTPKSCTLKILEKFQIKRYFTVFITSDRIEKGKPNPDMIYKACKKLNVNPEETVLIGDTQNDVRAGRKAGCTTIGIKTNADIEIDNIEKLLDILEI